MRATILELPATWGTPQRALDEIERRIVAPADLVLLPEATICGYVSPDGDCDLTRFAEPIDGPIAQRCAEIAAAKGVHLVAPLVLREGRDAFNAMACFAPDGSRPFVYRKRHPWIPETWATPGREPHPVVEIAGEKLTIAICYDVHFLVAEAARELREVDVLLFPSAWVEEPDLRVERLVRLARYFDVRIINANWAPGVVVVPGQGGSCIVEPDGTVIPVAR